MIWGWGHKALTGIKNHTNVPIKLEYLSKIVEPRGVAAW